MKKKGVFLMLATFAFLLTARGAFPDDSVGQNTILGLEIIVEARTQALENLIENPRVILDAMDKINNGVEADKDGDGFPDVADACPEVAGVSPNGCLVSDGGVETLSSDRDGDGIEDAKDACPDEYGPGGDGCPSSVSEAGTEEVGGSGACSVNAAQAAQPVFSLLLPLLYVVRKKIAKAK